MRVQPDGLGVQGIYCVKHYQVLVMVVPTIFWAGFLLGLPFLELQSRFGLESLKL